MRGRTELALSVFSGRKTLSEVCSNDTPLCPLLLFHNPLVTSDLASKTESAEHIKGGSAGDCPRVSFKSSVKSFALKILPASC